MLVAAAAATTTKNPAPALSRQTSARRARRDTEKGGTDGGTGYGCNDHGGSADHRRLEEVDGGQAAAGQADGSQAPPLLASSKVVDG